MNRKPTTMNKPINSCLKILTLGRPNILEINVPVAPDLAKTVKVKSDPSEDLTRRLSGFEILNNAPSIFQKWLFLKNIYDNFRNFS